MKKLVALVAVAILAVACSEQKEQEEIQTEQFVQKIDSIEVNIEEERGKLEEKTNEIKEDLKELDNI